MKDQNINEKDVKHLQWLYDRMVNVHGENKDYDYMIKFKEIIEQLGRAYPDKPHIKKNWDCIWEHNGKHYKLVGDDEHKEWEEVTPEEMDREFNNTKLNYIANTLKESANRMEYTGDISDLGNEIGVTVGHAYKNMTEENINDFIFGFRHGVSLTNGTH